MNTNLLRRLAAALATAGIAGAMVSVPAARAADAHEHHAASAPRKLALDHGRKWATDDTLRTGMAQLRGLAEAGWADKRAGRLTASGYATLATGVEARIAGIVAGCKLEPKADAMLHLLLADVSAAAEAMAGKDAHRPPRQGLAQLTHALADYGRYFDDPGFRPLRGG